MAIRFTRPTPPAKSIQFASLLALSSCFFSFALNARGAGEPHPYHIRVWKADEGLPQSSVTAIVQAHDGYLWVGTFNGLARFDGVRFKVFEPGNTSALVSSRIVALSEDSQGALWAGTEEGDLVREVNGAFQSYGFPGRGGSGGSARAIGHSLDGALWIVTFDWQLIRFSGGQFSVVSTNWNLLGTRVYGLAADSAGDLWIGTDMELAVWRGGKFSTQWDQAREPGFNVSAVAPSQAGGCWVVGNGRLRRFADGKWAADAGPFLSSKAIIDGLREGRAGQVWVGTYGNGLFCYETNQVVRHLTIQEGLPSNFIRCLYEDREANLWIGTEGGGLARIKPSIFQSYGRQQGLSGDCVLSVCEGRDGELWIGTNGDGINRMKNGVVRSYGSAQGLTNEFVWSVLQDRNRTVWAGTWGGGFFRFDGKNFAPFDCPGQGPEPIACALYEDSRGALWFGEQRSRPEVVRLQGDQASVLLLPARLPRADARAFAEDSQGNLWIGTHDDGLYRLKDGQVTRFGQREGLTSERIRSLYADSQGLLWIGTSGGGLNRREGERFSAVTTRDGLVDDFILHIEEDDRGNLWFSSGAGVFRASKADLNQFARRKLASIRCLAYTRADGLPSLECTGGFQPSGCKTRDGRLWFPTVNGLAVVDPKSVPFNTLPPPVWIEEIVSEGTGASQLLPIPETRSETSPAVKIPPGRPRCEFHYTGLSLTAPEKVRFQYRLQGVEDAWVEAGPRRAALYSYLLPGHYTFHVRACNNDGVWNERGASLALIILPHFWQTWWFRSFAVAAAVLLFVGAYEIRLASERRLTRLRLRLARDLHDEVGSNLGSIALLTEVMPGTASGAPEEISDIRRIAVQTIDSLRDIVWFLDPANDNMGDLVLRLKDTARAMLPGIPFTFGSEGDGLAVKPSLEVRRNLFPILKEILHNVARHAHASRVEIALDFTPRQFQLKVTDNGLGFDEPRIRPGNGLKNLRRRAADLGGSFEIQSRPGAGTAITVSAPIT